MKWIWTVPILAIAASGILAAAELLPVPPSQQVASQSKTAPGFGPKSYNAQLSEMDRRLMLAEERGLRDPEEWLVRAKMAESRIARFRLTHDTTDIVMAGQELAAAKELAPPQSGPLLPTADYSMAIHDLPAAQRALNTLSDAAVPLNDDILSEIAAIRADIAFYQGDVVKAGKMLGEANAIAPAPGTFVRLAVLRRATGKFDQALELLAKAMVFRQSRSPFALANLTLQMGLVESARGNYPAARTLFERADTIFPGYWLTELYLAEADAVGGDQAAALVKLLRLAKLTSHPEVMDALAMTYRAGGDQKNSRLWSGRAGAIWKEQVAQLPTAYAGHAAENELAFGDPLQAVKLARINLAARPYGEARLLLANALMGSGQAGQAIEQLELAEKSGWRSAPLYTAISQAKALGGDREGSTRAMQKAKKLNPRILDPETRFIWFAHG